MRKQVLFLLVVLVSFSSCDNSKIDDNKKRGPIKALRGALTGKWKVISARAGDEDITGLYQGYTIEFLQDGNYVITNPNGAPNPNLNNATNLGFWEVNQKNSLTLDAAVLMKIIEKFGRDRIKLSWDATIIGKGTNTYYWEIVPV